MIVQSERRQQHVACGRPMYDWMGNTEQRSVTQQDGSKLVRLGQSGKGTGRSVWVEWGRKGLGTKSVQRWAGEGTAAQPGSALQCRATETEQTGQDEQGRAQFSMAQHAMGRPPEQGVRRIGQHGDGMLE